MSDTPGALSAALADRYRIERELGAGGMATVYLAEDLKHHRQVAVKVLRPELAAVIGAERFLTEITTTANLQHPHILPLFDSGAADGFLFYVMPYVEGETVRDRISREKQLPIADAVRITAEVASALDYAHRRGVIHRDIKPENILLHDGRALVADFGIALAASKAGGSRMTETGMSLGTPHYMSPEQAMGEREITARSDVYALGCVAYEMLTGEPPFTGTTAQAIVARVVTETPRAMVPQRHTIPPQVEAAVLTALEKLPADRFATAAEFAEALTSATYARPMTALGGAASPTAARGRHTMMAAGGLGLAVLGLVAGWALWHQGAPKSAPVVQRYAIALPDSEAYEDGNGTAIAYALDGSAFAYVSRSGLVLRYSDREGVIPVPGARRGVAPFFSADGQWLGYLDGVRLVKVPLAGGTTVTICDSCPGFNFGWGSDDTVRYHAGAPDNGELRVLMAVSARGGRPYEIARPAMGSGELFRSPMLLPGRRTVLFSLFTGQSSRLAALDLRTGTITRFEQAGFSPHWVDKGYVVLGNGDGTLIALPFDAARVRPISPPVTVVRDVQQPDAFSMRAGISGAGSIVYVRSGANSSGQLTLVSRSGTATPLTAESKAFATPRLSPDGRRLAIGIAETNGSGRDVWTLDLAQQTWSRLTTDGISDRPVWTPDGRRIVYSSNADLWWIPSDGSGRPDSLLAATGTRYSGAVTPDGRALVFQEQGGGLDGIRVMVFDSAPASRMLIPGAFNESAPALSPDGHWLAYESNEAGRMEVYVRSYPLLGARVSVSLLGGTEPAWSRNGRELFYRSGDSVMTASVALSPTFAVTGRRRLFAGPFLVGARSREYDVTPDGQHFVMIRGGSGQSSLIALNNVFDRLVYDQQGKR
ncbi:MAG: protein kinase [Gemmatimonadales bacterium]